MNAKRPSMLPADGGTRDPNELMLGIAGYRYEDLFVPERLRDLSASFDAYFKERSPEAFATFDAYRREPGALADKDKSEALIAAAPWVSAFVARLFNVEADVAALTQAAQDRAPLWRFKQEFAKKRVHKDGAG